MGGNPVTLKSVVPPVPRDDGKKQQLIDAITKMGCRGLLTHPWNLKNEGMVQEFTRLGTNE